MLFWTVAAMYSEVQDIWGDYGWWSAVSNPSPGPNPNSNPGPHPNPHPTPTPNPNPRWSADELNFGEITSHTFATISLSLMALESHHRIHISHDHVKDEDSGLGQVIYICGGLGQVVWMHSVGAAAGGMDT